jgi:hypothetical protein
MSGLKNTVKRMANASMFKGYKTNREIRQEKALKKQTALNKMYSEAKMPDSVEIKKNERRKAAKRRGSRVSTIMSETDKETLG